MLFAKLRIDSETPSLAMLVISSDKEGRQAVYFTAVGNNEIGKEKARLIAMARGAEPTNF